MKGYLKMKITKQAANLGDVYFTAQRERIFKYSLRDGLSMPKWAALSSKIPAEDREKIRILVEKGAFSSASDFCRTAISRLLRDIEDYQEKKRKQKAEMLGERAKEALEEENQEGVNEDLEDLQRFIDDLY